jgi:hypothetical protein
MKKCKFTLPKLFADLMSERVKELGLPSKGLYLQFLTAATSLDPQALSLYIDTHWTGTQPIEVWTTPRHPPMWSIDNWLDKTNLTETVEVTVSLPKEVLEWLDTKGDHYQITKSKFLACLICQDVCHEEAYMNYRSIIDKKWLYEYWIQHYDCRHPEDNKTPE